MSPANEETRRRRTDPLVEGVSEGAHAAVDVSYQVLESVIQGFRESLRRQTGASPPVGVREPLPAPAGRPREPRPPRERRARGAGGSKPVPPSSPVDVLDEVADLLTEVLERGADLAHDVAGYIDERPWSDGAADPEAPLRMTATAGGEASVEFRLSNTGSTALKAVELTATELVWARRRLGFEAVGFEPRFFARIRPGGHESVKITVKVPEEIEPGTYRGLVEASPGGAWATLELVVGPKPEPKPEAEAEPEAPAADPAEAA